MSKRGKISYLFYIVIDLEGPKGIYIDDKKGYEAVIDER
jgi:hypothetical protein